MGLDEDLLEAKRLIEDCASTGEGMKELNQDLKGHQSAGQLLRRFWDGFEFSYMHTWFEEDYNEARSPFQMIRGRVMESLDEILVELTDDIYEQPNRSLLEINHVIGMMRDCCKRCFKHNRRLPGAQFTCLIQKELGRKLQTPGEKKKDDDYPFTVGEIPNRSN